MITINGPNYSFLSKTSLSNQPDRATVPFEIKKFSHAKARNMTFHKSTNNDATRSDWQYQWDDRRKNKQDKSAYLHQVVFKKKLS